MTITTSKDVEAPEVVGVKQPGFMTHEEAELQMKHGHSVRRASWPADMHMTGGKIVGDLGPVADEEDPDHDPADSNPDQTRAARRWAEITSGKKAEKKKAPERQEKKSLDKDDKAANDWTFWIPQEARTAG